MLCIESCCSFALRNNCSIGGINVDKASSASLAANDFLDKIISLPEP